MQISYVSIKSSLRRWRRKTFGKSPTTIVELIENLPKLEKAKVLCYTNKNHWTWFGIKDARKNKHVLFMDLEFISKIWDTLSHLSADGTFFTRPKLTDCTQLFIFMGIKKNYVSS